MRRLFITNFTPTFMIKNGLYLLILIMMNTSCNSNQVKVQAGKPVGELNQQGTFGFDVQFLQQHDSIIILQADDNNARIIVSPKYQAKVFTSTTNGEQGLSLGWINYKAFTAPPDEHMNAYGGENRLWLGPEGGQFSLFFKPGAAMTFENWKTPSPIDTEAWNVVSNNSTTATLQKEMELTNYKGTKLHVTVDRIINVLNHRAISEKIGLDVESTIKAVAYTTVNILSNKGTFEWTTSTGMPCMWLLDMFNPSPSTTIVIPFLNAGNLGFDKVATTNYFGEIPPGRLRHDNQVLYFKADGKNRGKLGITPSHAQPVAGSYDAKNKVLTITMFDVDSSAKYLNQEWSTSKPVFSGDAVNAYNDGPLEDGTQMGPFYELESVSPAAFLKPNQSLSHTHTVFHFTGEEAGIDQIARKVFGVSLQEIKQAF